MDALGLLFRGIREVDGPVIIYRHPTKNFYFIGELHRINGNGRGTHVWDVIQTWAKNNPDKKVCVIIEATVDEFPIFLNSTRQSPLKTVVEYAVKPRRKTTIDLQFANIRRQAPFEIFEAIYDINTFASIYARKALHQSDLDHLLDISKQFEKDFFANMRSRKASKDFFFKLLHPDSDLPNWFKNHLRIFGMSTTDNPLKELLREIRVSNPQFFLAVLATIEEMFNEKVTRMTNYSLGMTGAESSRRSNSDFMVAQRYSHFASFWISINAIFMDAYILCLMHTGDADIYVTIAGIAHVENMVEQFNEKEWIYAYSASGTTSGSDVKVGLHPNTTIETSDLMSQFLEVKRLRKNSKETIIIKKKIEVTE